MAFKVFYRKLWREQANGIAHCSDNEIELDERLKGKQHLEILIHEIMHLQNYDWSEDEVIRKSKQMCDTLWKESYRRMDNTKKYI